MNAAPSPAFASPALAADLGARARAAGKIAAKFADDVDKNARFPSEAIAALKAERLLGIMIPVELGGEGASIAQIAELCAVLGQHCSSTAMIYAMHMIKLSSMVAHGTSFEWHANMMRRIAGEQLLLGSSTTEGGIGGDLRNSICAVERSGDMFRLEKEATCISYGTNCDLILVTARANAQAPSSDQVMVVALKGQYSLERTLDWDTLGMRGTNSEGFKFIMNAPVEQILPQPFAEIAAQSMLATCHLLWSALWYGIASEAFNRAQAFVKAAAKRAPGAIGPGGLRLAEASVTLQEMRAIVGDGVRRYEAASKLPDPSSSMSYLVAMNNVKVSASQLMVKVIDQAVMICGLSGYKNNTPFTLGRMLRDAHSARVMISNDRILSNTSNLLLMARSESSLLGL